MEKLKRILTPWVSRWIIEDIGLKNKTLLIARHQWWMWQESKVLTIDFPHMWSVGDEVWQTKMKHGE